MKGPPPTPTALKLLNGNPGKRPLNQFEPQLEVAEPACPEHLDEIAQREWKRVVPILMKMRVLTEADEAMLGIWCQTYSTLIDLQGRIAKTGTLYTTKKGFRRYKKCYVEIPRKNGKSCLAAGVALYLLCADGEPGAEIYSAAVTGDQAKICWETAQKMVQREREMQHFYGVEPLAHSIAVERNAAAFKPLSRDADSLEGLNPHGAIIDELHAHKTREIFDVLNQATGSRRQPLLFCITTAGDNRVGVCFEQHEYVSQILHGRHSDERYWGVIYSVDKDDDWVSEASARKANPNYGVSVLADDIEMICKQAQRSAEAQNAYLTKRLNIWTSTGTAFFNMLAWHNRCKQSEYTLEDFYGERCYVSLDLASKVDIAVKLMLFRRDDKRYVFCKYYVPESALDRGNPNYDYYAGWVNAGRITTTPGNVIDFEFIEADLLEDRSNFQVVEVPFDPFQATELSTRMLKEGMPMIEVGATVRNFSEPMKSLDGMILEGTIKHDGDPVLGWMIGNVYAKRDAKDNVYPRKVRNENKIDGAVALLMALNREMLSAEGEPSIYESGGLKWI